MQSDSLILLYTQFAYERSRTRSSRNPLLLTGRGVLCAAEARPGDWGALFAHNFPADWGERGTHISKDTRA